MSQAIAFSIYPKNPDVSSVPLSDSEKKVIEGLPAGAWIGSIVALGVGGAMLTGSLIVGFVGLVLGLSGAIALHVMISNARRAVKEREKAERANKEGADEARRVSSTVNYLYQQSAELASVLPGRIDDAFSWLPYAEDEFLAKAFGSFWDAIESSTAILVEVNGTIQTLCKHSREYSDCLSGRRHTFPAFPIAERSIPDPTFTANELRRIARLGQTNFEFANIWEHRRTRQVLIEGFRSLADAVDNLGWIVEDSFSKLGECVSHEISRGADRQIEAQEVLDTRLQVEHNLDRTALSEFKKETQKKLTEQSEMLDNLQHGRKPGLLE